jgi:hypothetical protein
MPRGKRDTLALRVAFMPRFGGNHGTFIELEPEMLEWEMFSEMRTCKLCDGTFNCEAQRRK